MISAARTNKLSELNTKRFELKMANVLQNGVSGLPFDLANLVSYAPRLTAKAEKMRRKQLRDMQAPSKKLIEGARQQGLNAAKGKEIVPFRPQAPTRTLKQKGAGWNTVTQTEIGASIDGYADFTNVSRIQLNPGRASFLPWLSAQAALYDQYIVRSFRIKFVPQIPATVAGTVVISFDADAADQEPTTLQDAAMSTAAVTGQAWSPLTLPCPCDNMLRYVRQKYESGDIKTYDFGALYVGTQGFSSTTTNIGYLVYEYTIAFKGRSRNSGLSDSIVMSATHVYSALANDEVVTFPSQVKSPWGLIYTNGSFLLEGLGNRYRFSIQCPESAAASGSVAKMVVRNTTQGVDLPLLHVVSSGVTTAQNFNASELFTTDSDNATENFQLINRSGVVFNAAVVLLIERV